MKVINMADLDLRGKRVLIREDLNVPTADGEITSDARIVAAMPTLRLALEKGAAVMVMSHLGRPDEGKSARQQPEYSLAVVAKRIGELLGRVVPVVDDWLDGVAIAFHLNLIAAGVHYHVKGGYDPSYQQYSPGKVLHRLLLERAFGEGLSRYDFLGADEPYKLQWASEARELVLFQAFRRSPAGIVERAGYAYGRPLAKRALELRGRLRS